MTTTPSAIRIDGRIDTEPSGGLWLVKWLLLIPHVIVLSLLWLAFPVLTVIAMFAILFTARYPRWIFDFNLGVLRWTWRVSFYGYGALGTDRYPPFSLGAEPDYPATLDISYPERLSRGLALVKWWLLALPHYVITAFFVGGGFLAWNYGGGLITLLALIAGVALLFTGRYPRGIFDFVMGMNRWVFRVGAYAALMTDEYPPFRLDSGGTDTRAPVDLPAPEPPSRQPEPSRNGWTAGRVAGVVVATLLLLTGLGAAAGGGTLLWLDTARRDAAGYVTTDTARFTNSGYALRFDAVDMVRRDAGVPLDADWLGDVRVRVTGSGTGPLFIGIGRTEQVARYLSGVPHGRFDGRHNGMMPLAATRPPTDPTEQGIWAESTSGAVPLSLTWNPQPGTWSLVVMNADATPGLSTDLDVGATIPALRPLEIGLLAGAPVLLVGGAVLLAAAARPRTH